MPPNEPREIQFINLSHPAEAAATESQRRAHSHAARAAHARTRRLRTMEYRAHKATQHADDGRGSNAEGIGEQLLVNKDAVSAAPKAVQLQTALVPGPANLLASDRTDPFVSFARPLKPFELFLLDHCGSIWQTITGLLSLQAISMATLVRQLTTPCLMPTC